jgi:uridylate kinase
MSKNMPITVFDIFTPGNLEKVLSGERVGTLIQQVETQASAG